MDQDAALPRGRVGRVDIGKPAGLRRGAPTALDPLLRAALDFARPGLMVLDHALNVRLLTRPAADLLGVSMAPTAAPMQALRLLAQSPWLDDAALRTLGAAFAGTDMQEREILLSLPRPGGMSVVAMDLRRVSTQGWVVSLHDVTQNRANQDWLLEHAATDPVTGLWNRQHFMLMLRDQLELPAHGFTSVLLLDLSRFKPVNDTLGTAAGDALLRLVGSRLRGFLREGDMLARFASDEFAIMLTDLPDRPALFSLSERLAELIGRPFMLEGHLITVGAHTGAACAPEDGQSPEMLVANAGLALAAARAEARGLLRFYEPSLNAQARQRRALESDLRAALSRREFELHYQPQIDVHHHRIIGFEALVRWRSPTRGLVPPGEFIPLAEELGLIGDIGAWVLHTACREATLWPDDLTIAVNASPLQVECGGFADIVSKALAETGLAGTRLEIEITENLLLRDNGTVLSTFQALRGLGVQLVLDDFGTGYASLSQLGRFHFDKIKIDRGFISAPGAAGEHDAIVRAIAALGISLGVPTTAEGVETEQQLARVTENGCSSVQGYYFSRPVPAEAVGALIDRLNCVEVAA
jgi:diguanylate cyclase (GGDEF)-like protein